LRNARLAKPYTNIIETRQESKNNMDEIFNLGFRGYDVDFDRGSYLSIIEMEGAEILDLDIDIELEFMVDDIKYIVLIDKCGLYSVKNENGNNPTKRVYDNKVFTEALDDCIKGYIK